MATVPRYVGTTVAEAKAYVLETVEENFLAVFDADGDGAVAVDSADERAFVRAVCAAESEVDSMLSASHGAPFTGTIPDIVKEIVALRCLWCRCRVRTTMLSDDKAPFKNLYNDTTERLKALATDNKARIPTAGRGAPEPTATARSVPPIEPCVTAVCNTSSFFNGRGSGF